MTDPSARVIFSPATNGFGSPYAVFGFVSDDGDLVSSEASVTLNIVGTPYAFTQPAQGVTETSALLKGMATPNGSDSIAWFEWTQDGTNWQSTPANTVGDSAGVVAVGATITNLTSGIGYRFRVGVSNQFAVVYGAEQRFATGGKAWAWGDNQYGESTIPVGLDKVVCVSPAYQLSLALRTDGTVFSWGYPTNVVNYPTNVVALSSRSGYILGLNADGTVFETGSGEYGKIPVPDSLSNVVMIGIGGSHRMALKADGTVTAWGRNSYGQTNVPAGLSNVVSISAGAFHSMALKADGTVISWGDNTGYETNTPSMTNVIGIAAGFKQGMALKADGHVVTWGNGAGYGTKPPASETNIVAIASYDITSLALRRDGTVGAWGYNGNGQASIPPIRHALATPCPTRFPTATRKNVAPADRLSDMPDSFHAGIRKPGSAPPDLNSRQPRGH